MKEQLEPAIEALKRDLHEQEKKVADTKSMINKLCEMAGLPPLYERIEEPNKISITGIRSDTFYSKSIVTAARELLEMRHAAGLGPTSPREIHDVLRKGGFQFGSASETNAITVVRNALSKASSVFHRLPNGDYGLAKWYDLSKVKRLNKSGQATDNPEIETAEPSEEGSADE